MKQQTRLPGQRERPSAAPGGGTLEDRPGRSKPAPPALLGRNTHSWRGRSSGHGGRPQTRVRGTSCDRGHRTWNRKGPSEPGRIQKVLRAEQTPVGPRLVVPTSTDAPREEAAELQDAPPQPAGRHGNHRCRATGPVRGTASRDRVRGRVSHSPAPNRPPHFLRPPVAPRRRKRGGCP